jgi:hypothetical protein
MIAPAVHRFGINRQSEHGHSDLGRAGSFMIMKVNRSFSCRQTQPRDFVMAEPVGSCMIDFESCVADLRR